MFPPKLKTATLLSAMIALLAFVAAVGGLLIGDLYRDNSFVTKGWFGNDLVTLVVAVPLLAATMILTLRGSWRARLVWLGGLAYMLYNYCFYLYGAALNRFFLLYVALVTLSLYALIFGLARLDVHALSRRFRAGTPVRWISGYMLFCAAFLGGLWIFQSLHFALTGQLPPVVVQTGGTTNLVGALDLTLVVSSFVVGGLWLWQRRPWGYVLGILCTVNSALYTLVLTAGSLSAAQAGIAGAADLVPLWVVLDVGSLVSCGLLLWNLRPGEQPISPLAEQVTPKAAAQHLPSKEAGVVQ